MYSVDLDQLASEKPADQDPHFLQTACKYMIGITYWNPAVLLSAGHFK